MIRYAAKPVIVVIPGIMGSQLSHNGERIWEPTAAEATLPLGDTTFMTKMKPYLFCDENGASKYPVTPISDNDGVGDAYAPLINTLKQDFQHTHEIIFFAYDWRLGNGNAAEKLEGILKGYQKIYLIAHSMGGLVASRYLANSRMNRDKVQLFISLGTPYTGAAKTMACLETGNILGMPDDLALGTHMHELAPNYPSVYELLPTSNYAQTPMLELKGFGSAMAYNYDLANSFWKTRPWARKDHGAGEVKSMMTEKDNFSKSLILYDNHAADTVKHYRFAGTGLNTPKTAVYKLDELTGKTIYLYDEVSNQGDDTVLLASASNNSRDYIEVKNCDHGALARNPFVLDTIRQMIQGRYAEGHVSSQHSSTPAGEPRQTAVIMEGTGTLQVMDNENNPVYEDNGRLYAQKANGALTSVGSVWAIDPHAGRKQYTLYDGYYYLNFSDTDLLQSVLVVQLKEARTDAVTAYTDFNQYHHVSMQLTPDGANVKREPGMSF